MSTIQQTKLSSVSCILVSPTCSNNPFHVDMNVSALNFSPKRPLICEEAIVIAAADVNPDTTGSETNSTKNPETLTWLAALAQKNLAFICGIVFVNVPSKCVIKFTCFLFSKQRFGVYNYEIYIIPTHKTISVHHLYYSSPS